MGEWRSATIEEVKQIVARDLTACDAEQLATFRRCAVEPYLAPITRYGESETVVVVARNGNEVIYYEDVEDGFNVSPLAPSGEILEHRCNQDELRVAVNYWIGRREASGRCGPATAID